MDFYNESVKDNLREIFINYLLNDMDIPLYSSNSYVAEMISNAFTEDFIKQFLYAYNYYEKWYHLDLDGIKLSDFLFFNGTKISSSLNTNYLITSVLNTSESNRATNNTVNFYNAILKGKVNMNFQDFLPYVFKTLNGYDDPSDWIVDHFEGILYEQSATGTYSDEVIYRIWPIMARNHMHVVLPILSAPQEDMYIITCPSQFIIGSLNRYSTYLNKDGNERTRMYDIIVRYANALGDFYGISAGFIPNAVNLLNTNRVNIQYDTRFYFPASDKADEGTQSAGTTRDPVMKWVYEAIGGAWAAANGAGAYATGYDVWWVVDSALGDINRSIHVFTHETAHNQDGSYFYGGNGRRWYTGAEAHADGVIAQEFGSNAQFFNVTNNFAIESDYTTNLTYERINTEEKIDSYYREMFETKYVLEYLAAQAFLRLSYEEQAKVAIQLQYSTTSTSNATSYVRLTAEDFENMDLQTVADLWDNQIAIRGTGSSPSAQNGSYGFDSFYNFYFHIPNNPKGTSDTNTFKNTGYEMLGFAGYDKGFITYMSRRSTDDLDAIQKITGDSTMTWRTYKLNRYANVENNLNKITYFDTDEIINLYESAFKKDASNNNLNSSVAVTKLYYGIMKRATNDFRTGGIYSNPEPTSITTAEQLIEAINNNSIGNYRIDADLDFSNISPVEGKTYYIENRFFGTIDGNGHKLLGMKYTLFNSVTYAHIKNITILSPEYSENIEATLALNSNNVVVFNYNVTDSNLNIPAIKNKSGSMFSLGTNDFTMRVHYINSLEDFLAIDDSNISRASKYVLNTDLDFSSFSKESGQSVITGIFTGIIDGNGYTIKNLNNYALFEHFRGSVRNLTIQDFRNVKTGDEVAAFARNSSNATFSDMRFINITLEGRHRVAPVVALDNSGSTFERISVTNINVKGTGFYISGLVGRKYGGVIQDVYVDGDIEIYTTANGGIAGSFERNVTVSRVISNVNISRPRSTDSRLQNGGFVGYLYQNNSRVSDSISLGNMTGFMQDGTEITSGKFVGLQNTSEFIPFTFSNCYEYALATGVSGLVEDAIKEASNEDIYNQNFYKDILHFDETIWDFDSVSEKGYPQLK